jgi:uncharacterized protein (DUF305 family)
MGRSRRTRVAVAVGVAVAAVVVAVAAFVIAQDPDGGGDAVADDSVRIVQPGAPGERARELSQGDLSGIEPPGHSTADTEFMRHMRVHHAQALEMAALVDERTDSADLPLLAERISRSQETEIDLIEQWLAERGEQVEPAEHPEHELMPGMATAEQLAELHAARGRAFDALFLDLMIAHHQGALVMVQELYAAGGGLEPAIDHFAREVEADQTIEIERMIDLRSARES